jgi:hypothetical protein
LFINLGDILKRELLEYTTPDGFRCPECERETRIIPLLNDFDHQWGTHYPLNWGYPVTECCEVDVETEED